tara:strand:- start:171 stop:899 length:729 start_codon:yes stop_codon:yes gene_type:complete
MINNVQKYIEEEFFSKEKFKLKPFINADNNQEIYHNEANLQYELALSLKEEFKDKIEIKLEYPVQKLFNDEKIKLSKKEIDIIIKIKNKKDAFLIIELKFPKSDAGMPLALLHTLNDIQFCEQIEGVNKEYGMDLYFMTIFLTNKDNWTSKKHIYHVFQIANKIRNENSEFKLNRKTELKNPIQIISNKIEKDEKRMKENKKYLNHWISDSNNKIIFKNEHIINWRKTVDKWLYFVHKIKRK